MSIFVKVMNSGVKMVNASIHGGFAMVSQIVVIILMKMIAAQQHPQQPLQQDQIHLPQQQQQQGQQHSLFSVKQMNSLVKMVNASIQDGGAMVLQIVQMEQTKLTVF